jgi:hypothetical protein
MVNPFTPQSKFKAALTAVRLSKRPRAILLVTNDFINVTDWIKTYTANGAKVYVHVVGEAVVYTSDEYLAEIGGEMILDTILRSRYCEDRAILEDFAEAFGDAVGWTFSGPIRSRQLTAESFDSFKSYETLPYAGKDAYYYKDQLMEASEPTGRTTVTPTLKTRLLVTQGVPTDELIQFRDFLLAAHEQGIENFLELDWAICETCGHPVRTVSDSQDPEYALEAGYCPYCDTMIPGFESRIYSPYVEEIEDDENWLENNLLCDGNEDDELEA